MSIGPSQFRDLFDVGEVRPCHGLLAPAELPLTVQKFSNCAGTQGPHSLHVQIAHGPHVTLDRSVAGPRDLRPEFGEALCARPLPWLRTLFRRARFAASAAI